MSQAVGFLIEAGAQRSASRLGLSLDRLKEMAAQGAVVTHPQGNRRFHNWVMQIEGVWILGVASYSATAIALSRSS